MVWGRAQAPLTAFGTPRRQPRPWWLVALLLLLWGCRAPVRSPEQVQVYIDVAGEQQTVQVPAGTTVQEALKQAGIQLGPLDRTDPPPYTLVRPEMTVQVIRVEERFEEVEEIIPFERRLLRNEALPEGESRLVQAGKNGRRRVTYRILTENGQEVARQAVKEEVLEPAVPEIVMVGVRQPLVARPIPGRLAYLAGGNAWVMEGNTGVRRPVVLTGDLDGRVFRLSPDGRWLLFTRQRPEGLNSLWVVDLEAEEPEPQLLQERDVVHFADFSPVVRWLVAYSTVEPRPGPPGWQANNDLWMQPLRESGPGRPREVLEARAGGVYGWWGTRFLWHPEGYGLAYARADAVGFLPLPQAQEEPWLDLVPYQTQGDWAWVPGISWSPRGDVLYTVMHGLPGQPVEETDPVFSLVALAPERLPGPVLLVEDVGMFAYPQVSPLRPLPDGEEGYWVAYLQALFPRQSETSRYRLMVMDRDGSNKQALFPAEGEPGLTPQEVRWSPAPVDDQGQWAVAFLYEGDLYLALVPSGEVFPLTRDGLVTAVDWR